MRPDGITTSPTGWFALDSELTKIAKDVYFNSPMIKTSVLAKDSRKMFLEEGAFTCIARGGYNFEPPTLALYVVIDGEDRFLWCARNFIDGGDNPEQRYRDSIMEAGTEAMGCVMDILRKFHADAMLAKHVAEVEQNDMDDRINRCILGIRESGHEQAGGHPVQPDAPSGTTDPNP